MAPPVLKLQLRTGWEVPEGRGVPEAWGPPEAPGGLARMIPIAVRRPTTAIATAVVMITMRRRGLRTRPFRARARGGSFTGPAPAPIVAAGGCSSWTADVADCSPLPGEAAAT